MPTRQPIEYLNLLGTTIHLAPLGLLHYAECFLEAGKAAPPVGAAGERFNPVGPYLVCHSAELALKAFLSMKGRTLTELKENKFRHRIVVLLDTARDAGLTDIVPLTRQQQDELKRAADYYGDKVFEYPDIWETLHGCPKRPDVGHLIAAAEMLIDRLREPCLSSAEKLAAPVLVTGVKQSL